MALGVLIIAAIGIGLFVYLSGENIKKLPSLEIHDVNLNNIADGAYLGSYKVSPVSAEVRVTVEKHKITKVELLKHETGKGKPAEVLTDRVVQTQSLKLDTVSGATYSSKVILKAIENALTQKK
jgi:uncharacterized protein with FMN-binding domain